MASRRELEKKYGSSTNYILRSLIPYSEPNVKLAFSPNRFFNDLEKLDSLKIDRESLRSNYYRLIKKGLIKTDEAGIPRLTNKGERKIKLYKPKKLGGDARILLTFDIPEVERRKRNRLRTILRELRFEQIQKSVWSTDYDVIKYLQVEVRENNLQKYINVYESSEINL